MTAPLSRSDIEGGTVDAVAYHEAGHAAVGIVQGRVHVSIGLYAASVAADGCQGLMGEAPPATAPGPPEVNPRLGNGSDLRALLDDAVLFVAGAAAEDLAAGVRRGWAGVRWSDRAHVEALAWTAFPSADAGVRAAFAALACEEARNVLTRHWTGVREIVARLLEVQPNEHGSKIMDGAHVRLAFRLGMEGAVFPIAED